MKESYLLAIDQGTTGSRAILYDATGHQSSGSYQEFTQYFPKPGWVEHDAVEIFSSVRSVIHKALKRGRISPNQIAAIAITNQRETIVLWNRHTGKPVHRAIVWQDRRTSDLCQKFKEKYAETRIREKTGLVWDAYFSATKICWLLEHNPSLRKQANRGDLLCGTIDTWILWNLTAGRIHATDFTNASRTMLFDIKEKKWDSGLLELFKIPKIMLPEVKESGALFGKTAATNGLPEGIPVQAVLGDQQAALYGQSCYESGQGKNTYGTGCFLVLNLGPHCPEPVHGLLTTLACDRQGKSTYALEGSIFIAGAAVQWLRDGLLFFRKAQETEKLIHRLKSSEGVTVIPAFVGLGSPHWNSEIRGQISGITRGTTRAHIIRATLESVAHQTADVLDAMTEGSGHKIKNLHVDGGMTHNHFLMQFQADLLRIPILVSDRSESSAWGVAKLAGRRIKFWKSEKNIDNSKNFIRYSPKEKPSTTKGLREVWKTNLNHALQTCP
ncbi:MAG: glycerol kinase [Candidatus Omnitrophica bacterium]|nr:glycerol kinase [Candidatus Omnitrophota bacterium]